MDLISTEELVVVRHYKGLTKLVVEEKAVETVDNIGDGDCIVCFNKQRLIFAGKQLEAAPSRTKTSRRSLPSTSS